MCAGAECITGAWCIQPAELSMTKSIGQGGFATVWLAEYEHPQPASHSDFCSNRYGDHEVAVKKLKESIMEVDSQVQESILTIF